MLRVKSNAAKKKEYDRIDGYVAGLYDDWQEVARVRFV